MAAHRYWRLYFTAVQSGNYCQLAEVKFFASADCQDRIWLDGANTLASHVQTTYTADKVLDEIQTTYWSTGPVTGPWWWRYTFPEGQERDVVGFCFLPYSSASATPKDFALQYSDDGTTWTTLINIVGNTRTTGTLFFGCYPKGQIVNRTSQSYPNNGGRHKIAGVIDRLGVPGSFRVRLFTKFPSLLMVQKWSGADGSYEFTHLKNDPARFIVEAYDHTGPNPAVAAISDQVILEPMDE